MEPPAGARVLVVDDEPDLLPLYARVVDLARAEADVAATAARALDLVADTTYSCALLDKNLPDMSGVALAELIRRADPSTQIVMVTGYASVGSAVEVLRLGCFDYVQKPFEVADLVARLRRAVDRHHAEVAARPGADERRRREAERAELQGLLLRADRLATLGTLAGGVGHEINNINTVLLGTLQLVEERAAAGLPPEPGDLANLKRAGEHLKLHARHLLTLGRPGPDHEERFDLRELVLGIVQTLTQVGKLKFAPVRLDLPTQPLWVTVNRTRLEQVLVNLLGNAVDALEDGARRPGQIRLGVWQDTPRGRVFCRVVDTGCGMAPERLARVFEPYFTTKPAGRGTGLGLPVVRQIVESYGGMIRIDSAPGRGTTVVFDVPTAQGPAVLRG